MNEYFFKSIHKKWIDCLKNSTSKNILVSPYLTPTLANSLIESINPKNISIYTRFSLEDFASKSTSLSLIKNLTQKNYNFFEIKDLHAKVILIPGFFASIGSQNLTNKGKINKEATFCTADQVEVNKIEIELSKWLQNSKPITLEMIELFESELPKLEKVYDIFLSKINLSEKKIDNLLLQSEINRKNQELLEFKIAACQKARRIIKIKFPEKNKVPENQARFFIEKSAWWLNHAKAGRHIRAKSHSKRVRQINGRWEIKLGANSFEVEIAILRCLIIIENYLVSIEENTPWDTEKLVRNIRTNIRASVKSNWGEEYKGLFPVEFNDIKFGNQSIDIRDFTREILLLLPESLNDDAVKLNEILVG